MHARPPSAYACPVPTRKLFVDRIRGFCRDDRGQGLVEYALILATISVVAIAALNLLGHKSGNTLQNVSSNLS